MPIALIMAEASTTNATQTSVSASRTARM